MQLIPEQSIEYAESYTKNSDAYGHACFTYAERWAEMMEQAIVDGKKLEDVAEALSHEANKEGITGFMYGAAVSILSKSWIYGEQLRRWHNLQTQIGDEGKRANEKGTVLNPALMTIGL